MTEFIIISNSMKTVGDIPAVVLTDLLLDTLAGVQVELEVTPLMNQVLIVGTIIPTAEPLINANNPANLAIIR